MNIKERIVKEIPIETDFSVGDIVEKVFPDLVRYDTEGRKFNRGASIVARELRKIKGIIEVEHLKFWAADYVFE